MKTSAIPLSACRARMGRCLLAGVGALALLPAALSAQEGDEKPVTDESVNARDVAATPIQDLNLEKDPIPPLLLEAQKDPYSLDGLRYCRHYAAQVRELDVLLGEDFDIADPDKRSITVGRVAKSVVGALIPFRGVIREISGANKHERQFQDAIVAGVMRRAFLKGMGLKLGCAYPARPADEATRARIEAERAQAEEADD